MSANNKTKHSFYQSLVGTTNKITIILNKQ